MATTLFFSSATKVVSIVLNTLSCSHLIFQRPWPGPLEIQSTVIVLSKMFWFLRLKYPYDEFESLYRLCVDTESIETHCFFNIGHLKSYYWFRDLLLVREYCSK